MSQCPTLDPTIVIEFRGRVPSKKNRYSPRKDKPGFFKDSKLQAELDRLAMQIPGQYRDLKLESPIVDFFFCYVKANWDRDNAAQALTDLLVEYGVLANDNIRRFNGTVTIHPAVLSDYDGVTVAIRPA